MYLIVGLGNPGKQYEKTRHNVGFMAVDELASTSNYSIKKMHFKSLLSDKFLIQNKPVILVKPQTFMNLSGESVMQIAHFYKVPISDIIVIYDELAFNLGTVKIKKNGSAGGHNGIKSLMQHMGTEHFTRIRIGIGLENKNPHIKMSDYVLQNFSNKEFQVIQLVLQKIPGIVSQIINSGTESAMNKFNANSLI